MTNLGWNQETHTFDNVNVREFGSSSWSNVKVNDTIEANVPSNGYDFSYTLEGQTYYLGGIIAQAGYSDSSVRGVWVFNDNILVVQYATFFSEGDPRPINYLFLKFN